MAINERISSLRSKEARIRKEAGNPVQMPISHRVIPIGVRMNHKMVLRNVTPVEAGLFLTALNYVFNEDPFFGGKISLGYGAIEAEWAVSLRSGSDMKWKELDRIDASALAPIEYHNPDLNQLIDDWKIFAAKPGFNLSGPKDLASVGEKTGREKRQNRD